MDINELVKIGFTIERATDLSEFFSNDGYIGDFTAEHLVEGYKIPTDKIIAIGNSDTLKQTFKADSQFYKDIDTLLAQNGNSEPNRGGVNKVLVYQKTDEADFGEAFDKFMEKNANFSQISISSRNPEDIEKVADKLATADRLFEAQTSDESILTRAENNLAKKLSDKNNDRVKLTFHKVDSEAVAMGIMGIQSGDKLGSNGDVYSKITNVSPQIYTGMEESNLKDQNVSFYTSVNPVNGGGVSQYATNIYFGGKMINGENAKRRRIRYYFDKTCKARSLDFLAKKLGYEDSSCGVLEGMLTAIFREGQYSGLVVKDSEETNGFSLTVLSIAETKRKYISLYNQKCYKVIGWYIDKLTGEKVDIALTVDPSDADKSNM